MADHHADHDELMARFKRALGRADAGLLAETVTEDFEWHLHHFPGNAPAPTGTVRRGVAGVMEELSWRADNWSGLHYEGVTERYVDDRVFQTFTISGTGADGAPFACDAIDVYRVADGRLALKDTYWKQAATGREGAS